MRRAVGRVVKPHGVRGELTVEVRTDTPRERFSPGAQLAVERDLPAPGHQPREAGAPRSVTVDAARNAPAAGGAERLLVRFREVTGREDAEALRGMLLTVDTAQLPAVSDPEQYYDHQLEGLAARLVDGDELGQVREVLHSPAGETLVVTTDAGEVLIPFLARFVPVVDLDAGFLTVDPPEGLLPW